MPKTVEEENKFLGPRILKMPYTEDIILFSAQVRKNKSDIKKYLTKTLMAILKDTCLMKKATISSIEKFKINKIIHNK
jgi:hypothetical protein